MSWLASVAAAVVLFPTPGPGPTYPSSPPPLPAIVALSVGDSLTYGADGSVTASYRGELSRLMNRTGQPHEWRLAMMPGSKCSWWVSRIDALITQHDPDVIFLNCGTNDTPSDTTESDYRAILSVARSRNVRVVASYIGRPDMESATNTARPWIDDWMHSTNDAIGRALSAFPSVPAAPMWRIPADPEWLQPDGIHWTPRSEAAAGQLFYQAAQQAMPGWLTLAQLRIAEMCGLHGHRRGTPWPAPDVAYRVCRS